MTGVNGFGGFGGNMMNKYSTLGNTGMTKADTRNVGMQASADYRQQVNAEKSAEYAQELSQMGQMYRVNVDPMMADTNGDGRISKKEFTKMEKMIQQYAIQNQYQAQNGQGSQGGNAFGMLNSLTDTAGNIAGMFGNGGDAGASGGAGTSGGGNFMEQAAGWVKGLFS